MSDVPELQDELRKTIGEHVDLTIRTLVENGKKLERRIDQLEEEVRRLRNRKPAPGWGQ